MLEKGTLLGGAYRVEGIIGMGGGGIVYKAYHERLETCVVVKQVRDTVRGKLNERGEADILKRIKHACLPGVYDFLEIDGEIYTVMEYVQGQSLDKVLKERKCLPEKEVLKWTRQLADALKCLHSQEPSVIHSDIKPSNIMLTPEGNICLIDFNVSLVFDREMRSVAISGGYSPPEQYQDPAAYHRMVERGQKEWKNTEVLAELDEKLTAEDETLAMTGGMLPMNFQNTVERTESAAEALMGGGIDTRSDIYSLGATIYHLLTGIKPPVDFSKLLPINQRDISVSEGFMVIIQKMMAFDPRERYQNGGELLYALDHIYEFDSEYQSFRRSRQIKNALLVLLYAAGISITAVGVRQMGKEVQTAYNHAVEYAGELIDAGEFNLAEKEIQRAYAIFPEGKGACEKEILRLYSMGEYQDAVRYGRELFQSHMTGNVDVKKESVKKENTVFLGNIAYVMGNAYLELKDYENAIQYFALAIERNKENGLYFRDYAIALAKAGKVTQAEETLDQADMLSLGDDSLYLVKGEIAFSQGKGEEAAEYLETSIRMTSEDALRRRAVYLCAQVYQKLGDDFLDKEIAVLESAQNIWSIASQGYLSEMLGDAYARKAVASPQQSEEYYTKALDEFWDLYKSGYSTIQMMENIAIIYQQKNAIDEAEKMLLLMKEKYPGDYRADKRLAFLEADRQQQKPNEQRDYDSMAAYYKEAVILYQASGESEDMEMEQLANMMEELKKGGWL